MTKTHDGRRDTSRAVLVAVLGNLLYLDGIVIRL